MELLTARLLLRRPLANDAADALMMLRDPDVVRWNPAPAVVDAETARAWCARGADWSDGTHATWHAVDPTSGRLVANCSIFAIDRDQATAQIGYRVAPWQRRQGIGSEVTAIITRWAFAELGLAQDNADAQRGSSGRTGVSGEGRAAATRQRGAGAPPIA